MGSQAQSFTPPLRILTVILLLCCYTSNILPAPPYPVAMVDVPAAVAAAAALARKPKRNPKHP
ncbi:hypothetical protein EX30DRAFT_343585 [Ascodesmis nigricans]|uniref:Uncharacterized protein n=1 Tax=Ascodesmis nigricans TaxID=341454 RepID=A0A4S2MRX1_9PEZI|nr:hypothetical protein EX30DRAFT_343585 [Ascodesmis nigricans]